MERCLTILPAPLAGAVRNLPEPERRALRELRLPYVLILSVLLGTLLTFAASQITLVSSGRDSSYGKIGMSRRKKFTAAKPPITAVRQTITGLCSFIESFATIRAATRDSAGTSTKPSIFPRASFSPTKDCR